MGGKGDKLTGVSVDAATELVERLAVIDGITSKKMFGGNGIFHDGKMFGIVDSKGQYFLKADDTNREEFETAGAEKHGRMPYYSIPASVLDDRETLISWVSKSIAISS